jgi:FkbM family methyltransferase
MPFVSYTRNFEDVMLNRVFDSIPQGFYVDVGAFHPAIDSNTYALYRRGWRGIVVEPEATLAGAWRELRPDDVLVQAACGASTGHTTYFTFQSVLQFSTTTPATADLYRAQGVPVTTRVVPLVSLNDLLARHRPSGDIHCMSIDVEGGERAVLEGLDLQRYRPWVILLESVEPGRPVANHEAWEPLLLSNDYEFVYFDEVNRFYLAREQAHLKRLFACGPCVWDDFVHIDLVQAREELAQIKAELAQARAELEQLRRRTS